MEFIFSLRRTIAVWRWPRVTIGLVMLNLALFAMFNRMDELREQRLAERGVLALVYYQQHPYLTPKAPLDALVDRDSGEDAVWSSGASSLAAVSALHSRSLGSPVPRDGALVLRQQAELDAKVGALAQVTDQWQASSLGYVPAAHNWWGLVTYQFVHGSWLHLLGNLWILWLVGSRLEKSWGRALFVFFYLSSGIVAASTHQALAWHSTVPLIGASGAIAGLLGALAFHHVSACAHRAEPLPLPSRARRLAIPLLLVTWFAFELSRALFTPWREGSVSHFAHVGGFVFGLLCAWMLRRNGLDAHKALPASH